MDFIEIQKCMCIIDLKYITIKKSNLCKKAFTLAEVLVTLAIIGVVAAMVIAPLVHNIEDTMNHIEWGKGFSTVSQAYNLVKADEGGTLNAYFGDDRTGAIKNPMLAKFKRIGSFDNVDINDYTVSYKSLDGTVITMDNLVFGNSLSLDGMQIFFRTWNPDYSLVWVDVNGYDRGPNVLGKDLFGATMTKDWIKPMGAEGTGLEMVCNDTPVYCISSYGFHPGDFCAGAGCSAVYLKR